MRSHSARGFFLSRANLRVKSLAYVHYYYGGGFNKLPAAAHDNVIRNNFETINNPHCVTKIDKGILSYSFGKTIHS